MNVIGIHDGHNASVAAIHNGKVIAAFQEERLSRLKNQGGTPVQALEETLRLSGIDSFDQVDRVVVAGTISQPPYITRTDVLQDYANMSRFGKSWLGGLRSISADNNLFRKDRAFSQSKLQINQTQSLRAASLAKAGVPFEKITFVDHHTAHASSAYYGLADYDNQILVLTNDGAGDGICATVSVGHRGRLQRISSISEDNSLATIYAMVTYIMGMTPLEHEYKIMGLAPYGEPRYVDVIMDRLIDVKPDGSFWMDMSYFNYCQGLTMTSAKFHQLFDRGPREPESEIEQLDMDLAASVQRVTEEIMLRCARFAHEQTGLKNLCMAGGVALNCVGNGRILREGPFDAVWIQPAAGDAGGALGVSLLITHQLLDCPRERMGQDRQRGSLLGPGYGNAEIRAALDEQGAVYDFIESRDQLSQTVAEGLAAEKVVGLFQGAMEFGPRALGCRSILGDPRSPRMQRDMNVKVKFRESFRPFAMHPQ